MLRTAVVGTCVALLAKAVVAAPGDGLVVTGDLVNVRAGPSMDERVSLQVRRDQRALELAREGEWVRVELAGRGEQGWIHRSLLQVISRASPAADNGMGEASSVRPEAARGTGEPSRPSAPDLAPPADGAGLAGSSESEALARFRAHVDDLNARARALAQVELFTGAEPAGRGAVRVLVTDAWRLVPEAGQESYTNALFDHWRAVADGAGPLRLQVVDPSGTVLIERTGPVSP